MDFGKKPRVPAKNKVGLDIGAHAIKMLEISWGANNKPALVGLGLKKVTGASKQEIAGLVKTLAEESKISTKEVNISVSGPSVIVRFISMPKMEDESLKSAIRFEAEKFIPFNINDCIVDFQILKREDKENKLSILLVASKKDPVQEKIKLVEEAGFTVNVVDVDSFALTNSFLANFPPSEQDTTFALLNIGAAFTNLSIVRKGSIYFARDVAIGSNDFNLAISKRFGVDVKAAEILKISPKDKLQEISSCTRAVLNNLLDDIKLSFSYYENQSGRNIDEIYVSGGGSAITGLDEALQESFGSKLSFWNPLEFLKTSTTGTTAALIDKVKNSFSVAAGLALR